MNTKTSQYYLPVLISIALFAAGCGPKETINTEQPAPTELPAATATEAAPNNSMELTKDLLLDPAITQDKDSLTISGYIYEGLVTLDGSGQPQPGIAESWVVSDDQLDYIFTLRPGITFSDGTAITPDIVADNFNRWFDPKNALHQDHEYAKWQSTFLGFLGEKDDTNHAISTVDGIQKVDSNTVLLHLNQIVPETLVFLADPAFAILNTSALATSGYGTQESKIISSGPYVLSSWTDNALVLSPNPDYWGEIPTSDLNFTLQ